MYRSFMIVQIAAMTLLVGGCGKSGTETAGGMNPKSSALTAASLGEQTVLSPQEYLMQDIYTSADTGRGEALSMQCRACHSLEESGGVIVGPNLYGVFGRTAGSDTEYPYSEALAASGFIWTPRALDAWLAEPFTFLPGNRMTFPGLVNKNDRNAVIAYLLQQTSGE